MLVLPLKNNYPALEKKYLGLELGKMSINKAKTEVLASVRAPWLGFYNEIRTEFKKKFG